MWTCSPMRLDRSRLSSVAQCLVCSPSSPCNPHIVPHAAVSQETQGDRQPHAAPRGQLEALPSGVCACACLSTEGPALVRGV